MRIIKNVSFYFLISLFLMGGAHLLQSKFIINYLTKDLLTLLIALFGLNIAVLSILLTKISDVKKTNPDLDLLETTKEMKFSLVEFFVLILISFVAAIVYDSKILDFSYKELLLGSVLLSALIYSLVIIWDTGNAVFILISEEEKFDDQDFT